MPKLITTELFVERARQIHGDIYDYSNTVYIDMKHKVEIGCSKHGVFEQLPQPHLKGQGCPQCGKEKQKATMMSKYGVDNPMKSKIFYDKARQTCCKKYGANWARSTVEVKAKCEATNLKRYGVKVPLQNEQIKEKMKETNIRKYGVPFVGQVPEFRDKAHITSLVKYGSIEPLSADSVRNKICITNQARYGGNAPLCSKKVQEKVVDTCLAKYNVSHPSKMPEVRQKVRFTKAQNGTFSTSSSEELLFYKLCELFGYNDVLRQYSSSQYPFACDFYIQSRDLYIELNALWTHGHHWFNPYDYDDYQTLLLWQQKQTDYYDNAIRTWTVSDVVKRNTAYINKLNYIVFWDTNLKDFDIWVKSQIPNGYDWYSEYMWM